MKIRNLLNIYKESLQPRTALRRVAVFLGGAAAWAEEGMWGRDHCKLHPRISDRQKTLGNVDSRH